MATMTGTITHKARIKGRRPCPSGCRRQGDNRGTATFSSSARKGCGIENHRTGRRGLSLLITVVLLAAICVGVTACKPKARSGQPHPKPDAGIHKIYTEGPATCIIDADRAKMTIADQLHLKITVVVAPDYTVKLPPVGEKLSRFGIKDYHTTAPELTTDGRTRIIRTYVLDPFLSGTYTLPAITIHFWKTGEKQTDAHSLTTEDIPIKVRSLLPETLKKMKLHDIAPPVPLPQPLTPWIWAAAIFGAILAGGMIFYFIRMRRNAPLVTGAPYLPPHEAAYRELERLISENLIEKGEVKAFYQAISGILRRYIENRFGIHAPEQTTEEFLAGLKTDTTFPEVYHTLLREFLRHCDLVKFAAHQPTTEDIQNTFDSCKKFITETRATETEASRDG